MNVGSKWTTKVRAELHKNVHSCISRSEQLQRAALYLPVSFIKFLKLVQANKACIHGASVSLDYRNKMPSTTINLLSQECLVAESKMQGTDHTLLISSRESPSSSQLLVVVGRSRCLLLGLKHYSSLSLPLHVMISERCSDSLQVKHCLPYSNVPSLSLKACQDIELRFILMQHHLIASSRIVIEVISTATSRQE